MASSSAVFSFLNLLVARLLVPCAVTLSLAAGCDFSVPLAGKSCPNGVSDCPSTSTEPYYCTGGAEPICLPGIAPTFAENIPPLVEPALIIARAGEVVEASFGALDPDSRSEALRFTLASDAPANGAITVERDGRYRFVAATGSNIPRRATFSVRVEDEAGGATVAVMTAVVIATETADLLTWTGEDTSAFLSDRNWSPAVQPRREHSVFIPMTETFAPRLSGNAVVFDAFIGPGVPYALDGLVIEGEELFSASNQGTGSLVIASNPVIAGTVFGLRVEGRGHVEASLRVSSNLNFASGGTLTLAEGATLSVGGDLVQPAQSPVIRVDTTEDGMAEIAIDGALILLGAGVDLGRGRLSLAGNLEAPRGNVRAQEIVVRGKEPQVVVAHPTRLLPPMTSLESSDLAFASPASIGGDLDVSGALGVRNSARVFVFGTLELRASARLPASTGGEIFANACVVAPGIVVPAWVHCDAEIDAGPATADDAGAPDAGVLDAGVPDSGVLDAGAPDAGVLDAGVPDAGVFDAGVPDAGVFDAGVFDAGVFDAGLNDGGAFDAGLADGGRDLDGCAAPSGRLRNAVIVVEGGQTRTQQLTADIGTDAAQPTFVAVDGGEFGTTSTYSLNATGELTVSAGASEGGGYHEVAIGMVTISGNAVEDCAVIRVVAQGEGFRPVPPSMGGWNWNQDWAGGVPPGENDTVFVPQGAIDGLSMNLSQTVRTFMVETGADVRLTWSPSRTIATDEIALGGDVEFGGAGWMTVQTALQMASAVQIPELECFTPGASLELMGPTHFGLVTFGDCTFDLGNRSALVDTTATFTSTLLPVLRMDDPSARLYADSVAYSVDTDVPPLSAGEIRVYGQAAFSSVGTASVGAVAPHRVRIQGDAAPAAIKITLDMGRVNLQGQSILSMGEVPVHFDQLRLTNAQLCLSNTTATPDATSVRVNGALSEYAFGDAWTMGECEGNADVCEDLADGSGAPSCPFAP